MILNLKIQMGIQNLGSVIRKQTVPLAAYVTKLTEMLGRKPVLGVDAMVLLHKYLIIEAEQLCKEKDHIPYIAFSALFKFVTKLQEVGFVVYFIFDGRSSRIKCAENMKRDKVKEKALEAQKWEAAYHITPLIIAKFIEKLISLNIEYVISPFEADPQLYYMQKTGMIDVIFTIDTDLVAYGSTRVIFDITEDNAILYENLPDNAVIDHDIKRVENGATVVYETKRVRSRPDVNEFDTYQYRLLALLLGNDYVHKIRGIGKQKGVEVIKAINLCFDDETCTKFNLEETTKRIFMNDTVIAALKKQSKAEDKSIEDLVKFYTGEYKRCYDVFDEYPVFDLKDERVKRVDGSVLDIVDYYVKKYGVLYDVEQEVRNSLIPYTSN